LRYRSYRTGVTPPRRAAAYRGGMKVIGRLRGIGRRHPHADIAVAAVVYAVTLVTTAAGPQGGRLDAPAIVVAAVACGVLVARRRWPYLVFLVSAIAAETYLALHEAHQAVHGAHQGSMVLAAPLIALYTAADTSSRRRAWAIGLLAMLAFAGAHMLVKPSSWLGADNVALAALGALAVAAGDASRSRRAYLAEVEARARRAEHDRDAQAARRVTDERLRIARELHDVVGHHLALINVQAAVATHVLDTQPVQSRAALAHIRQASKSALVELRDTIGLLRQPDEQPAPTEPISGLAGLPELLSAFRRSGLIIDEHVDGTVGPIAVAADLTAYRLIQESLTNVCKHAGPTTVAVRLRYQPDALQVVVDNEATTRGPVTVANTSPDRGLEQAPGHGHGIVGMRERVAALGGTLSVGLRPNGGYRVTATLPLPRRITM
jgi:signal transduction histidine kinase